MQKKFGIFYNLSINIELTFNFINDDFTVIFLEYVCFIFSYF